MKKITMLLFAIMILTINTVNASSFSNYYPGGKNYLEEANFNVYGDTMSSIDTIKVKPNTTYTISMPGLGLIDDPYIEIFGYEEDYVDGYLMDLNSCNITSPRSDCTFTTHSNETGVSIAFSGEMLAMAYNYYGFVDFQLEEGSEVTEYEEYIIPLVDSTSPEFNGSGAFIMAYYETYDISEIINAHIVAIDDIDGDITNQIMVVSDHYTSNMGTIGDYLVELKVSDSGGNTTYFDLTIMIKDEVNPELLGEDMIIVDVDETSTLNEVINSHYIASDDYDGALPISVEIDNYTENKDIIGLYDVTIQTSDSSGNRVSKDITISVEDIHAPILDSDENINMMLSNPLTIYEIIDELSFSDNYDSSDDLMINIISDEFTQNNDVLGLYEVELEAIDLSGNRNQIVIYITVVDDIAPVVTGPTEYSFSYTDTVTITDLVNLFSVSDNYDTLTMNDIVITLNTFSGRTTQVGNYELEFELSDNSSNSLTHHLDILVYDDQAPIIYIDDYVITVSENASFSKQDALRMMINNHEIPADTYTVTTIVNEYEGNEDIPGSYDYSLVFTNDEGQSYQKDFIINVKEPVVNEIDNNLVLRNVFVYATIIGFIGYVIYKNKK